MLNWNAIQGAAKYTVDVDGTTIDTTAVKYDLSTLTENKTYVIKVKAIAQDTNTNVDSDWATQNYLPNDNSGTLTGPTSPDALESRIRAAFSQQEYEAMFPMRFGTDEWWKDHYWEYDGRTDLTDYYSYDNLIAAARLVATKIIRVQWHQGSQYTFQVRVTDKITGEEILIAPG